MPPPVPRNGRSGSCRPDGEPQRPVRSGSGAPLEPDDRRSGPRLPAAGVLLSVFLVLTGTRALAAVPEFWHTLLHYNGGVSDVVTEGFFLHENGRVDPAAELETTIRLLHSEQGREVACRFPLRYLWLRDRGMAPDAYDLTGCQDLAAFVEGFQADTLTVVFAAEHIDTPASISSSFGHILLVFRDHDRPLSDADTIHYAAENTDDPFLKYAAKGLLGGYLGSYRRTSFSAMERKYSVREQRAMDLYRLDLERHRIERLIYHLYELDEAWSAYYFLRENCAYGIARLLEIAYEEYGGRYLDAAWVFPIAIVEQYRDRVVDSTTVEPSLRRARRLREEMGPAEKRALGVRQGKDPPADAANLSEEAREYLSITSDYLFHRYGRQTRFRDESAGWTYTGRPARLDPAERPAMNHQPLLGMGHVSEPDGDLFLLRFRAAGKDLYDHQLERSGESELVILDLALVKGSGAGPELEKVVLFGARKTLGHGPRLTEATWSFYLGLDRDNSNREMAAAAAAGWGGGAGTDRGGAALTVEAGLQEERGDGALYLRPRADLIWYPLRRIKTGAAAWHKFGTSGSWQEDELYLAGHLVNTYLLVRWIRTGPRRIRSVSVSLNRRF